ncbi:UbiE family methyltransferase [Gregarina niphandrodes]|uniref:UbiE family methyltransferase n=1 Tax=Gregarina niphandrodes TaxID=110365 RepID=A0A023B8G6_GRENI|nr:UbiE family methyltransferase [Gregarina niphandrodes]EZG69026.1 UbiE family methyltransferase [Gregarina niphandrodes]|eukprot:XP_011134506.1 UbiE family methyltransferase [Gregarina niphandrodes]
MKAPVCQAYYAQGFDEAVCHTHCWRTAENCADYVLPLMKPWFKVLDVGFGPGTITCGLAAYVPEGSVVGIEPMDELISIAETNKTKMGVKNVEFLKGSCYSICFDDNTFDLVHAHQVLLHLEDPVLALKEMLRVVKPDGYVCVREADLDMITIYPEAAPLKFFFTHWRCHSKTQMGRQLKKLAMDAGFTKIDGSISQLFVSSDTERAWFYDLYTNRVKDSKEAAAAHTIAVTEDGTQYNSTHDCKLKEDTERMKQKVITCLEEFKSNKAAWAALPNWQIVCQKS